MTLRPTASRLPRNPQARLALTVRLPRSLIHAVEHLAIEWDTDRAHTIERLVTEALEARGGDMSQ